MATIQARQTVGAITGDYLRAPQSYAKLTVPATLDLKEGSSQQVALNLIGIQNHNVSWRYSISYDTAGSADLGSVAGSGSMSFWSTSPANRTAATFNLSALRDDLTEASETAWLVVELGGNMSFADGSYTQRIQINIVDDNIITGTARADILRGTSGADRLTGGGGGDRYYVTAGDIVIEAERGGVDTVYSADSWTLHANVERLVLTGTANSTGTGNSLNNTLTGNNGDNTLNGGAGNDTLRGGKGDDLYVVDSSGDAVVELANQGIDAVRASVSYALAQNVEHLQLQGGAHIDGTGNGLANEISGNMGRNTLSGGAGADTLSGGQGNDHLIGGTGADRLIGGAGADVFVFQTLRDSTVIAAGRDTIVDFRSAQGDKIDLSDLDANTGIAGDQAFSLIGTGSFTGTAGELRLATSALKTVVLGDVDGDGAADFAIQVNTTAALSAADFIL